MSNERTSVLGPTIRFKGELSADEDLVIQGKIDGTINHKQRLTIGRDGTVNANIDAQTVVVEGALTGNVRADKSVTVRDTARLIGNITAPSVAILEGANFNGSVDMSGGKAAASVTGTEVGTYRHQSGHHTGAA